MFIFLFYDNRKCNEFMLREYNGDCWRTYTWSELRWVDDRSRLGTWFLQQKLYYTARPSLLLGGGAAWVERQNVNGAWNTLARAQFELNPNWALGNRTKLSLRNRSETRWWENRNRKAASDVASSRLPTLPTYSNARLRSPTSRWRI